MKCLDCDKCAMVMQVGFYMRGFLKAHGEVLKGEVMSVNNSQMVHIEI